MKTTPSRGDRRLEVLELLALVRHVDSAAWTTLMGKLNYIDHIRVMPKTTLLPPFNIAFEETDSIEYIDTVLSLVLTPIQDRVYDQAFLDLKQRILSMTDDPDVLATVSDIRIFAKLHDSDDRFEVTERIHHWLAVAAERGNRSLVQLIGVDIKLDECARRAEVAIGARVQELRLLLVVLRAAGHARRASVRGAARWGSSVAPSIVVVLS